MTRMSSRARFEQRAAAVRRRPWRVVGAVVAAVALLVGVGWIVWASPLLAVTDVSVVGVDGVDRDAVLAAAAAQTDVPLARVDTGAMAGRIAAVPVVREVEVTRAWPHTLAITVTPRLALLAVVESDGSMRLVDDQAVAFRTVTSAPAGIAVVNRTGTAPADDGLRAVIGVLRLLPDGQRAAVTDITVSSASLVRFKLGAIDVVWGGLGQEAKKLTVLQVLLKTTPAPTVIDVSAPDTPVTR